MLLTWHFSWPWCLVRCGSRQWVYPVGFSRLTRAAEFFHLVLGSDHVSWFSPADVEISRKMMRWDCDSWSMGRWTADIAPARWEQCVQMMCIRGIIRGCYGLIEVGPRGGFIQLVSLRIMCAAELFREFKEVVSRAGVEIGRRGCFEIVTHVVLIRWTADLGPRQWVWAGELVAVGHAGLGRQMVWYHQLGLRSIAKQN